ncbi:reverse transcriptase [Phytophthora megakarya]|uniref:Reverse transcriptase n=1 Tax=Phytophthora megakarya TaxID=4795 RepID=A0A225VSY5_9STRA|nr:reverse transcriptase [Phytophthora megakarya]
MVKLQEKPKPLDMTLKIIGNSAVVRTTVVRNPEETKACPRPVEQTHPDLSPEVDILDPDSMADVANNAQVPEPSVDAQSQTGCSTPVQRLEVEYARVMRVSAEELDLEAAVYLREGSDLMTHLRDQLIMLPEIEELTPECNIDEANVGVPGVTTPEMEAKMRRILKRHRSIFLGDGNAAPAPAPARGVVCDIAVGEAKPVALRARQIAAPFLVKVFELLKKLLEAELIEHLESEWSSPIVIVLKKNGINIRMCIDYRLLNLLIKLSRYPLPLIDDLPVDFKSAMWFMSLDMASGFWAVRMTEHAKLISAFVSPFGHFQWLRMHFGLKNAPLIYQSIINNCLWGFIRLPPEEEAMVDSDVLEFLNLET